MTTPNFHLGSESLLDYATGAMPEPMAVLVATHLTLCPSCRAEATRLEALGGELFDELDGEPVSSDLLSRVMTCLDDEARSDEVPSIPPARSDAILIRPLCAGICPWSSRSCRGAPRWASANWFSSIARTGSRPSSCGSLRE